MPTLSLILWYSKELPKIDFNSSLLRQCPLLSSIQEFSLTNQHDGRMVPSSLEVISMWIKILLQESRTIWGPYLKQHWPFCLSEFLPWPPARAQVTSMSDVALYCLVISGHSKRDHVAGSMIISCYKFMCLKSGPWQSDLPNALQKCQKYQHVNRSE